MQIEESHRVGHRRARFAHLPRDVILLELKIAGKPGEGTRFFDRIEVFALKVFNEGEFQDVLVARAEAKSKAGLKRLMQQIDDQLAQSGIQRTESVGH